MPLRLKGDVVTAGKPVIFLHIGAMKTGTTFLQQLMIANKDALAAAGYLFPGARWYEQDRAVRDILDMARRDPPMRALCIGMWEKLATEMLTHHGRASIFSMEFLSFAGARQAARVIESLERADVHVILTVRDAVGAIPAQWQTHCRNGGTVSWPRFARSTRWGPRLGRLAQSQGARVFQQTQGVPRMLGCWGRAVPPERLHVITVPPSGSDPMLLWQRFAGVVGLDPRVCSEGAGKSNPSLGQPSADLMRRINAKLGRLPASLYQPTLKAQLANNILTVRSGVESSAVLDHQTRDFALAWNQRVRARVQSSGAHVVGDLSDLPTKPQDGAACAESLVDPSDEEILAAAEAARAGLVRLVEKRSNRLQKLGARDDVALARGADWLASSDPVDAAVTELTGLARAAIELHSQVASAKESRR